MARTVLATCLDAGFHCDEGRGGAGRGRKATMRIGERDRVSVSSERSASKMSARIRTRLPTVALALLTLQIASPSVGADEALPGTITTVAGGGAGGEGSVATEANINEPEGVALDAAGNLLIAAYTG